MMMSQLSMDLNTEESLTSFPQVSHANRTPLLDFAKRLVMSVTCGVKSFEYYGRRNQHGSWERTCQDSLPLSKDNSLDALSMTWGRWGIALDGAVMELKMSEQFTKETEYSLLATPTASQDYKAVRPLSPSEANGTHGKTLVGDIGNQLGVKIGESGKSKRLYLNPEFVETMMGFPTGWTDLRL